MVLFKVKQASIWFYAKKKCHNPLGLEITGFYY